MAVSLLKIGIRTAVLNMEKNAGCLTVPTVNTWHAKRVLHTREDGCTGSFCVLRYTRPLPRVSCAAQTVPCAAQTQLRRYGRRYDDKRRQDSDSGSDSDTECKGVERSEFWRRKMRTLHNLLDVDKDGLISYSDLSLFAKRFIERGHLDQKQTEEFQRIIRLTWEQQWGTADPYNFVSVERYLEDMNHVLGDKSLKKKAHLWLPYLFQAVDKDKSGFISVVEFKLFFDCLGLSSEDAAVSFAIIDTNGDGKLSIKEFVKLGKDFFFSEDEARPSRMFWGPLVDH